VTSSFARFEAATWVNSLYMKKIMIKNKKKREYMNFFT